MKIQKTWACDQHDLRSQVKHNLAHVFLMIHPELKDRNLVSVSRHGNVRLPLVPAGGVKVLVRTRR